MQRCFSTPPHVFMVCCVIAHYARLSQSLADTCHEVGFDSRLAGWFAVPFNVFPTSHQRDISCFYWLSQSASRLFASSCLFVHLATWDNSIPTGRIIVKCYVGRFLLQFVDAFEFSLKPDRNTSLCPKTYIHLWQSWLLTFWRRIFFSNFSTPCN